MLEVRDRLGVPVAPEGAVAGAVPVRGCHDELATLLEVVGERLGLALADVREPDPHRLRDRAMHALARRTQHGVVRRVAHQRVLEDVRLFVRAAAREEQTALDELHQILAEYPEILRHDGSEHRPPTSRPQAAANCTVSCARRHRIEACRQQLQQRRRDGRDRRRVVADGERAQLLDEQRHAVGSLHDAVDHPRRERLLGRTTGVDELHDVPAAQASDLQHRHVLGRPRGDELGPRGEEQEETRAIRGRRHVRRVGRIEERDQELTGGRVRPVEILEHEQGRAPRARRTTSRASVCASAPSGARA
jgi:hypothetical protein